MVDKITVYDARHAGRTYCCDTEGSDHYKKGGIEPLDLMISKGVIEDFCIGNIIKYATRFKLTRNLTDLKKVSDYSHILCGVELLKDKPEPITETAEITEPSKLYCIESDARWITKGKVYEYKYGDIILDDGDFCKGRFDNYKDFADHNPTFAERLVPLVSRPAKVGEWIYVNNSDGNENNEYKNGDVLRVYSRDDESVEYTGEFGNFIYDKEYLVLDGYTPIDTSDWGNAE